MNPEIVDRLVSLLSALSAGYQTLERKVQVAEEVLREAAPEAYRKYQDKNADPKRRGYSVQSMIALEELRKMLSQD